MRTRWECIGKACCQFLDEIDGFRTVAKCVTNTKKTTSQRNKVASDLFSLMNEPALLTMSFFLSARHKPFWEIHFSWLKCIDSVTNVSGHISRHMSARAFIMKQHLMKLSHIWPADERFQKFNNRKNSHNEKEKKLLHETLPNGFFKDAMLMFKKHFATNWCSANLMQFTLVSVPEASSNFVRLLLNITIEDKRTCIDFCKDSMHLPSFMTFIGDNYSLAEVRKQCFFAQFQSAILKIADGLSLFDSDDNDVLSLKAHVQESWLPLPSATQLAESIVKNTNFCKSAGKDEANTSNLAAIRSANITSVDSAIKESDQFRNRKGETKSHLIIFITKCAMLKHLLKHILEKEKELMHLIMKLIAIESL